MTHYLDAGPAYEGNNPKPEDSDLIQAAIDGVFGAFHSDFFLRGEPEEFFELLAEKLYDMKHAAIIEAFHDWRARTKQPSLRAKS